MQLKHAVTVTVLALSSYIEHENILISPSHLSGISIPDLFNQLQQVDYNKFIYTHSLITVSGK